jgi:hypothetical protein
MNQEKLPDLEADLKEILDKIIMNSVNRNESFYEIGQKYLLGLNHRPLFLKVVSIFDYFLKNEKKWVGKSFIVPEIYQANRHTTKEIVFRDMTYYVREDFMWSVLYKKYDYIKYDETGTAYLNEKPEVRITEMNMEKKYSKNEHGGLITTNVKPELSKKLPTGFTVAQSNEIINAALVGYMVEEKAYKNEKKVVQEDNYTEDDFLEENSEVANKNKTAKKTSKKTTKKKM